MRSALLAALLLALAVGQIGTTALVLMRHQRGQRRAEALRDRTRGDEETASLTHIAVPAVEAGAALTRIGRREVRFEGRLYDVVSEAQRGDTLHLWLHWDREEEEAVIWLAKAFDGPVCKPGLTATPPHLETLRLLYVALDPGALHSPVPERLRYAPAAARAAGSPFDDVPHPPPRG